MPDKDCSTGVFVGILSLALWSGAAGASLAQETPAGIIAAQVRVQGHACDEPRRAERDVRASKPNQTVWILTCKNATYLVTLVPDMAARIEVRK
jgi:hypothetical protein